MTAPTFFTLTGSWVPDTNKGYISGFASIEMLVGAGDVLPTSFGGTIVPHLIPAEIVNGVLCDQTGRPGVSLIANTPALNLSTQLYYEVVFTLTYHPASGLPQSIKINPVTFPAPTSATTIDLGSVTPGAGVDAAQIASVGSANITDATTVGREILTAVNAAAALAALGGAAVPSAGLVKSTGTALTPAVSGTDYAPPTSGSSLLKGNGSGGFSAATPGTDYAPATTGSSLLKANGAGGFSAASSTSDYVPWSAGTGGILPATSGQKLTTQGGNTLDDGSGNVVVKGGTLDGVTIGATTRSPSINANTLVQNHNVVLSGSAQPWLNQNGVTFAGTLSGSSPFNQLVFNDQVTGPTNYVCGLNVQSNISNPSTGPRLALQGQVIVGSSGTQTAALALYVGVHGIVQNAGNLGGTSMGPTGNPIGGFTGGWFQSVAAGGTNLGGVVGCEVDVSVANGASTNSKNGLRIVDQDSFSRGVTEDYAILIASTGTASTSWSTGIVFGSDQSNGTASQGLAWPFATDSILMRAAPAAASGAKAGNPCGTGIDLSGFTFSDCAIKTGPAPIQMGAMASAPATPASGKGKLYIASDGSLHYLGASGTDTRLAVA